MRPVLANDVMTNGGPRAPSVMALALSVFVHGALLAAIGDDLLHSTAEKSPADMDVTNLSVTLQEPRPDTVTTPFAASEPAPSNIKRGSVIPQAAPEQKPEPRKLMVQEQPSPLSPAPSIETSSPANPATLSSPRETPEEISAAIEQPTVTDSIQQQSLSQGILIITPVYSPAPRYPVLAKRMGLEGRVLMRVMVAANGLPVEVEIIAGSGHSVLDRAALDAVRDWRFQVKGSPARNSIEAVEVPIRFELE